MLDSANCMQTWQNTARGSHIIANPITNRLRPPSHSIFLNSLFMIFNQEIASSGRDIREKKCSCISLEGPSSDTVINKWTVKFQGVNISVHVSQLKSNSQLHTIGKLLQHGTSNSGISEILQKRTVIPDLWNKEMTTHSPWSAGGPRYLIPVSFFSLLVYNHSYFL